MPTPTRPESPESEPRRERERALPPLTDEELVSKTLAGDFPAFERLVERYRDKVHGLLLRMLRDERDVQDAMQETFLSAFKHLPSFRSDARFGTWLYRIAANSALMSLRKRRRTPEVALDEYLPHFSEEGAPAQPNDWSPKVESGLDETLRRELGGKIQQAVEELPDTYRAVFLLRDIEELSNEEVAEILDLSVAAVKSRLHRARLFLRDRLSAYMGRKALAR